MDFDNCDFINDSSNYTNWKSKINKKEHKKESSQIVFHK